MNTRLRRAGYAALAAVFAVLALPPPTQAAAAESAGRLRVDLDQLSPRVVEASTQTVTVTGTITNTGDRKLEQIDVRLQRGDVLDTESGLRTALGDPQRSNVLSRPEVSSVFQPVVADLAPSQSVPFSISVPLNADKGALKLDKRGIYPVVLNFNGVPAYGRAERVGALSTLLPVLSVPGGGALPPPPEPTQLSVLWPLIDDRPRQVETPVDGGLPVFSDDGLTTSLAGGRLFSLVDSVRTATAANTSTPRSLCFVIDPDLLETVRTMTGGYLVRAADGTMSEGSGARTAQLWLDRVKDLTRGQCVIALPFADADLAALSRAGTVDLQNFALDGTRKVEEILGTKPLAGTVWPDGGTLDAHTLTDLAASRRTTVIADSARVLDAQGQTPFALGTNLRALPYDELVASSLAPKAQVDDAGVKTSSIQNGLATLVFRGGFQSAPGQSVLVAPPRRWSASPAELAVFLQTVQSLEAQGLIRPLGLQALVDGADQGTGTGLDYAAADSGAEIPAPVTAEIARVDAVQRELVDSVFTRDDTRKVYPADLVNPLRYGLLRASSTAWRGAPDQASRATNEVTAQINGLLSLVTVNDPGRPLSLASKDSPLPVFITNGLPVTVRARINVGNTPGLKPEEEALVRIPAKAAIPRYLPTEVTRSGRFTVSIWLTTDSGTLLGRTSRVELNSTSYGSITIAVTGTAAGVLVLLVGLRLFRRIRNARRTRAAAEGDL
ncbi:DUF6049 family protein [Actinokineospora sp. NBRC 105648]|uniref:DUF6049 family protein n=1 Tax=Actinokineospora sp. NBRC 105648 TaxID=3032206 RepID=UPI0024A156EF|nr:DUF6049 family protein [Actinokineospora sp. NBRC 105648]GLZ37405.1 glycoprotein [Actinokineospora sp. NBRC 105648]